MLGDLQDSTKSLKKRLGFIQALINLTPSIYASDVCTRNKISLSCWSTLSSFPYTYSAMLLLTCEFMPVSAAFPCEMKKKWHPSDPVLPMQHSSRSSSAAVSTSQLSFLETFSSLNLYNLILLFACYCLCFSLFLWDHYALFPYLDWTQPRTLPSFLYSPNETTISSLEAPCVCLEVLKLYCQPPFWMMLLQGQHLTFISPWCLIACQA